MATSTCMKCGDSTFELKENSPLKSAFKVWFIQCSSCGGVVGVLDYNNLGVMLRQEREALKLIARQLNVHVEL